MMTRIKDRTGQRIGKLVVTGLHHQDNYTRTYWLCKCDCGKEKVVPATSLRITNTSSCGCNRTRDRLPEGVASTNSIFTSYKMSAEKRNLPFELSRQEFQFLISSNCYYCGTMPNRYFKHASTRTGVYYNGIDRVDNSKGYIKGNTVTCCTTCNKAKGELSVSEFKNWVESIYTWMFS